tara:strand:+ start:1166 stop:1675 length:510 start_codon:yes stop_codon:yes gene_type:complete
MKDTFHNSAVTSFPEILKVAFKPIHKSYLNVILIHLVVLFIGLFSVAFFIDYKGVLEVEIDSFLIYLFVLILFIVVLFMNFYSFKKRKYVVREKDISYQKGLFFKKMTTVPFNRIQHIEIDQGPISRLFNVVSLSVFTAGDSSDDLKIRGLLKEEAQEIKEYISIQIDG